MKIYQTRNSLFALLTYWVFAIASAAHSAEPSNRSEVSKVTTISDKELSAFVKAYVKYQGIYASYGPALERAKEEPEKKRIEQEANAKVKQSLEAQGLTADRYNKIFAAVNGDPELRQKVLKKVAEERQKS
jgi:hypothetical protein